MNAASAGGQVGGERGVEFVPVQEQEAVLGGRIGGCALSAANPR